MSNNKLKLNKLFTALNQKLQNMPPTNPIENSLDALQAFGNCVKKWCSNATTTSGAALCYADCVLESWGY